MTVRGRFRALYGAGPLHLLALVASFAIAAAAVVGWFQRPRDVVNVLEWFAAAIVIHDLVLLPLYSMLDRIAFGGLPERADRPRPGTLLSAVNPAPYLRIPAILSGLLLVVFFPMIFGLGKQTEFAASGIAERGYLARWLLATGVMFGVSGIAYALALARACTPFKSDAGAPDQVAPDPEQTAPEQEPTAADPEQTTPSEVGASSATPSPAAPNDDGESSAEPKPERHI